MKNSLYPILSGLVIMWMTILLWSCGTGTVEKEHSPSNTKKPAAQEEARLKVAEASKYSKAFLEKLNSAPPEMGEIELKEGMLILDKEEIYPFPNVPKMEEILTFTGKKDDLLVSVTLDRVNYTSVHYTIEMTEGSKSEKAKGTADMSPFFFLGSESDEDEETGVAYTAHEFSASTDDCSLSIRIGDVGEDGKESLRVKFIKDCNGEIRDIGLDDFPALKQK